MPTQRKRRVRPLQKSSTPPQRRRRPIKRREFDWKDNVIKFFIVLVLIIDSVLIFFIIRQCSKPVSIPDEKPIVEEKARILQIEVLNGCGVTGVAAKITDHLRAEGFDVVKTDNYESFNVLRTLVVDRRGNRQNGIRIAKALGLDETRVLQEVNEAYLIDATIIIGKDFRQLECWNETEP